MSISQTSGLCCINTRYKLIWLDQPKNYEAQIIQDQTVGRLVSNVLERMWKEVAWLNSMHDLCTCVKGMREHQDSLFSSTKVKHSTMTREFLLKYILKMGNIKTQNDDMHTQIC
jgi:hypothetical protein